MKNYFFILFAFCLFPNFLTAQTSSFCTDAPENLASTFSPVSGGISMSFTWDAPPSAITYRIQVRRVTGVPKQRFFAMSATSLTIASAFIGTGDIFEWRVRGICSGGANGQWSDWSVLAITAPLPGMVPKVD